MTFSPSKQNYKPRIEDFAEIVEGLCNRMRMIEEKWSMEDDRSGVTPDSSGFRIPWICKVLGHKLRKSQANWFWCERCGYIRIY